MKTLSLYKKYRIRQQKRNLYDDMGIVDAFQFLFSGAFVSGKARHQYHGANHRY